MGEIIVLALIMTAGVAHLFFPKQVIKSCEAFRRLTPFIPVGPFAGNVTIIRISGALALLACLAIVIFR